MVMAEYATRNRTPVRVGFYDIVRTIGRGNFAVVKLARHRITKTEVAIKIIDKMRLDQLNLKNIYREIQVLKLLTHQNIIKLYQVMETSSKIYLVCEYARNGELFDYITEQGRLPEDKAKRMFWQVLTAVEYCHKNNVVHRDLKAENLLLDTNNNVKLADFGFSNFYQSGSLLSTWCGSPPYAAPEVFEGKLYDGPHLDIWSLGVVLYVLVCGTFPFDGSNLATLKERVLGGRFRIPYWMSQDCENLVRRMLVINPKKRLTVAQIKKHKWMHECITTPIPSQATNSPKISRRGKLSEYNEHVLKIMQSLGINRQKIIESLSLSAYDHLYAIYHLLVDRLKLHRTSFPLEGSISYDGGRRRPSNVAEQAISSTNEISSPFLQQRKLDTKVGIQNNIPWSSSSADICFDEVTTGLPAVQHALATPVRYASPPLPQIRTSMYDGTGESSTMASHAPMYASQQHEDIVAFRQKPQLLSLDYKQKSVDSEKPLLGNYNLYKRRHTLMVPNPSQMQMIRAGMNSADQTTSQAYFETAKVKVPFTEQTSENFATVQIPAFEQTACNVPACRDQSCHCQQTNNLLLPCKNLPKSSGLMNFNQANIGIKSQIRRKSGIPTPLATEQLALGDNMNTERDTREGKVAFIIRQRQQLDSSPIGFRQGRRASDGLLLLGDNLLKEHLQKLAQGAAVPEIACENAETSMASDENSRDNNYLQIPNQNPVNRTKSAERSLMQTQTSPSLSPVGSGNNISYQPYDNSQSLARRRSLHAHQIQRNVGTTSSPLQYDGSESNHLRVTNQPQAASVQNQVIRTPSGWQSNASGPGSNCHWSSWKHVQGNNPADGTDNSSQSMWQQLTMMRSNVRNEGDTSTLAVASDEAVAMKAMTAQEQRDQKPIRQQSLPITSNNTSHPFGSNQHPSMAQMLQQRRLQRRLKVAATNMNQVPGYQLPEIEHLKIDNSAALQQNRGSAEYLNSIPVQQLNGQEWAEQQWGMQNSAIPMNLPVAIPQPTMDQNIIYDSDSFHDISLTSQFPVTNQISDQQCLWTFDFPAYYKKSFEFDAKNLLVSESLSNSAERLDHSGTESMEFAMF